jgi:MFS family permease
MRYNGYVVSRTIGGVFALFGVFWGGWAVAAADIEHALGLSTGGFGLLISLGLLGGASANFVGGSLCERFGTSKVLGASLVTWAALLLAGAVLRSTLAMELAIAAIFLNAGLVDVAINVAAAAGLADRPGKLVAFHARFNAGAAIGAALTGALLAASISWRWTWVGVAGVATVLAVVALRDSLPAGVRVERQSLVGDVTLLRREHLLLLAATFALAAMVEGGVDLWGVLFLRTQLAAGLLVGAGGAVLGYSVAALARSTLGPKVGGRGPARGVVIGAGTAAVGVALLASAPVGALGAVGLVLAAGGISMCWPLLVAQAGRCQERAGAVVGAVSACGYLGLVAGPAVVGWVAEAVGLRGALGVLAATALVVALIPATWRLNAPGGRLTR